MVSGGKRENSGRHKTDNPAKNRTIRLTDDEHKKFMSKGGVKWLRSLLTCFVLYFIFSMPVLSCPWYNPKTDSKPQYYDVSKSVNYRKKLEADFIKKYPDKKIKDYINKDGCHITEYQSTAPVGAYEKEVSIPYYTFCINEGIYKDASSVYKKITPDESK